MAAVWDTPHLAEGSPEPIVDPDVITVYNMRYKSQIVFCYYNLSITQVLPIC